MSDKKPAPPKCTGKRADGRPCRQNVLPGTTRCWHHSFKVPGRPSKLTLDVQERILDAVLEGAYLETAAQAVGVSPRTLHRWTARGDDAEARALEHFDSDAEPNTDELYQHVDPDDWLYLDFRHALKSAEAYAELELLRKVTGEHGKQAWTAYMTVLERRHPARWGRRLDVKHGGEVDLGKPRIVAPEEDNRREQIVAILAAAGALDGAAVENTTNEETPDEPDRS